MFVDEAGRDRADYIFDISFRGRIPGSQHPPNCQHEVLDELIALTENRNKLQVSGVTWHNLRRDFLN